MNILHGMQRWAAALLLSLPALGLADASAEVGRFKRATGTVLVEREGQKLPAAAGMRLRRSDVVLTGGDGSAGLTFLDQTRISLGADGRLAIDRFQFDRQTGAGRFDATLSSGRMAVVSGRIASERPDAMRVRTPHALLGIRAAEFVLDAGP